MPLNEIVNNIINEKIAIINVSSMWRQQSSLKLFVSKKRKVILWVEDEKEKPELTLWPRLHLQTSHVQSGHSANINAVLLRLVMLYLNIMGVYASTSIYILAYVSSHYLGWELSNIWQIKECKIKNVNIMF